MLTIYGIKNCDTMQKAMRWLDAKGIAYNFHNYKESGIDKKTIGVWLKQFPVNQLVNVRSTTYRELSDTDKAAIADRNAVTKLMMEHTSVIKRPVWDFGDGRFFLGWDEKAIAAMTDK